MANRDERIIVVMTPEEIRAEIEKVERAKKAAVRKAERCDRRIMELACEHSDAMNEENRRRRAEAAGKGRGDTDAET